MYEYVFLSNFSGKCSFFIKVKMKMHFKLCRQMQDDKKINLTTTKQHKPHLEPSKILLS